MNLLRLALAVLCLLAGPVQAGTPLQTYVYKVQANSCAPDTAPRFFTAFKLQGVAGLITALHGVVGCSSFNTIDPTTFKDGLTPGQINFDRDIVTLVPIDPSLTLLVDAGLQATDQVTPGERVEVLGYPPNAVSSFTTPVEVQPDVFKTWSDTTFKRAIDERNGSPRSDIKLLAFSGHVEPGHSGAPILDLAGHVIGVVQGGIVDSEIGLGVPLPIDLSTPFSLTAVAAIPLAPDHRLFALADNSTAGDIADRLKSWGIPTPVDAAKMVEYAGNGGIDQVAAMLAYGTRPDVMSADGETPLRAAVRSDRLDMARMLLSVGANPDDVPAHQNLADDQRVVGLSIASADPNILLALIGDDPAIGMGRFDATRLSRASVALRVAIAQNKADLLGPILRAAPQLADTPLTGNLSALDMAVQKRAATLVAELVKLGAGSTAPEGRTPLEVAIATDDADTAAALKPISTARLGDCSPLGLAIQKGALAVAKTLINAARINEPACGKDPPLFVAIHADHGDIVSAILEAQPFLRNPVNGEIPKDLTLSEVRVDHAHRLAVIADIKGGASWRAVAPRLETLLSKRSHSADDLLSAAAYDLDPEVLQGILANSLPLAAEGMCRSQPEPALWPISAAIAGFLRGPHAGDASAVHEVFNLLIGANKQLIRSTCDNASIIEQAAPSPVLLAEVLRYGDGNGKAAALADAAFLGKVESAAFLISQGASPCEPLANRFERPWERLISDNEYATPLLIAVAAKQPEAFEALFAGRAAVLQNNNASKDQQADCAEREHDQAILASAVCGHQDRILRDVLNDSSFVAQALNKGGVDEAFVCAADYSTASVTALGSAGFHPSLPILGKILGDKDVTADAKKAACAAATGVTGAQVICK